MSCVASLFIGIVTIPATLTGERGVGGGGDVGPGRRPRRGVELARTVIGGRQQSGVDHAQRPGVHLGR